MINKVLNDLVQKQLLDNTIVVISGDHGQEFNDTTGLELQSLSPSAKEAHLHSVVLGRMIAVLCTS